MKHRTAVLGWLMLLPLACVQLAGCKAPQTTPESACDAQPNSVKAVADIPYGASAQAAAVGGSRLDLYLPLRRVGEPLVIFVHGGNWTGGDKRSYAQLGRTFARCGIGFASVNYPLAPKARATDQATAILRAALWLRSHAAAAGYARNRIFLMGHSAGAELVLLAALPARSQALQGVQLSGLIAIDGLGYDPAADFAERRIAPAMTHDYAAAFGRDKNRWRRFNVMDKIRGREPPILIVHGLDDTLAPAQDSQNLADRLLRSGNAIVYLQPSGRDNNSVIAAMAHDTGDPTARTIEQFMLTNGLQPVVAQQRRRSWWAALAESIPSLAPGKRPAPLPKPDHVIVVVEENHSFSDIIDNRQAPYLNKLAAEGALFTHSYAVTHPSQPNYVALFSGQTNRNGDGCPEAGVPPEAPNLGAELLAAGFTFAGYSETLPRAGFTGCWAGFAKWSYARKHNPWVNFSSVPPSANQPFAALPNYDDLPTVAFIVPNLAHDMHSGSVEDADAWLQSHLAGLIEWGATHNALVVVTWDEDDRGENNRIPTIFVGPMIRAGRYDSRIDHYAVLRTIEDMYGLRPAGNSSAAAAITNCWR